MIDTIYLISFAHLFMYNVSYIVSFIFNYDILTTTIGFDKINQIYPLNIILNIVLSLILGNIINYYYTRILMNFSKLFIIVFTIIVMMNFYIRVYLTHYNIY